MPIELSRQVNLLNQLTNKDMIIKELYMERADGVKLFRTYSDKQMKIKKVGTEEIYDEAIDVMDFQYEETELPIEPINDEIL